MPLYKIIDYHPDTQILIWKITESFAQLNQEVQLNPKNQLRLKAMKSEKHQRAFLSVRKLIHEIGLTDFDLYYHPSGKPYLKNGRHISITHSYPFSAIVISNKIMGIDIERQQEKILKIAHKFVSDTELEHLKKINVTDYIKKLTIVWGAKEAIFKTQNEKGISFKNHIKIDPFELHKIQAIAKLNFKNTIKKFIFSFEEIETNFTLVYALEKNSK